VNFASPLLFNNQKQTKTERTMNSAALLVVLASSKAAGFVGGSYVTASVVLAGVVVSVEVAVDVLAAASSTLFLSFLPSVKILLRATDEVLSAAFDRSDDLVSAGARPLPFVVYSAAMSVACQFATFDDDNLSFLLPGGAGSYVAFLVVSYAVLLKFGADMYAVAVATTPKLVDAAARAPGLVASMARSFRAILAGKSRRYVKLLEFLLRTVPLFAVNQVILGASTMLFGKVVGRNSNKKIKKRVTFAETAQVREYSVTLGDHPEAGKRGGCPLSLDWQSADAKDVRLEEMERRKVGVLGRFVPAVERFARIVYVSGIDPELLMQEELRRRVKQAEDDRLAAEKTKRVTFNVSAQVREYSVTLGDNPCAGKKGGCPLSLDWEHAEAKEVRLEEIEQRKVGVMGRQLSPAARFDRIVQVSGIDPDDLVREERWRQWAQAGDDHLAAKVPDEDDGMVGADEALEEKGDSMAEIVPPMIDLCEPERGPFLGGDDDDDDDDDDYMDVEVDERLAAEVPDEKGDLEGEDVLGKELMAAPEIVPAVDVCELEHGPLLGGVNDDDDCMDGEVDERLAKGVPVDDGEPEGEDVLGKELMAAQVSVPADEVCEQEHGSFQGCDNNNNNEDEDDEEPVLPQEVDESALPLESAIPNPDPAMQEPVEAYSATSRRTRLVTFGNVHVQEYRATLGDHPCCDSYPLSMDWAHTEVQEYSLDWYEETKSGGKCAELSAEGRKRRIEEVTGIDPFVLEWQEEHRLAKLAEEKKEQADKDDKKVQSDDKAKAAPQEGEKEGKVVESSDENVEEDDLEVVEEDEEGYCEDEKVELDQLPAESFPGSVNFEEDGEPEDDEGKESKPTREHRIANLVEEKHEDSDDEEAREESGNKENGVVEFDGGQHEDEEAESSGGAEVEGGDVKVESNSTFRNSDEGSAPLLGDENDALAPLLDDGDDELAQPLDDSAQPLDDNESALAFSLEPEMHAPEPAMQERDDNEPAVAVAVALALEPELPHPEPAMQEIAVEAVPSLPRRRRRPQRHVTFGNVQVQEYSVTVGDHPKCDKKGGYPMSLDWAHTEVTEYDLDWYEATKPQGLFQFTAEGRQFVIQDISGMDRPAVETLEEQRLETIEQERIEQQQQRRQARSEARKAARALQPIRRSARLASKAPPSADGAADSATPLRRSARLANKVRCSYKV
jgi:hypothetical protein